MGDEDFGVGSGGPIEDAYLKVMIMYMTELEYKSADVVIPEMAKLFGVEVQQIKSFVEANYEKAKGDPDILQYLGHQPEKGEEEELRDPNQMWNGYCPESYMKSRTVRMRMNRSGFFESEETGLQMAVFRGVMAVILNFRGKGEFRYTEEYADEIESGELLAPQLTDEFPYHGNEIFRSGREIREYIMSIPQSNS